MFEQFLVVNFLFYLIKLFHSEIDFIVFSASLTKYQFKMSFLFLSCYLSLIWKIVNFWNFGLEKKISLIL